MALITPLLSLATLVVQALGAVFTAAVVVTTLWLVGAVEWTAGLLGLDHPALHSPIGLGA